MIGGKTCKAKLQVVSVAVALLVAACMAALAFGGLIGMVSPDGTVVVDADRQAQAVLQEAGVEAWAETPAADAKPAKATTKVSARPVRNPDAAKAKLADNQGSSGSQMKPGEVLVGIPEGAAAIDFDEVLAKLDCVATTSISQEDVESGWALLKLKEGVDVAHALGKIAGTGAFEASQPNFVYHAVGTSQGLVAGTVAPRSSDETPTWDLRSINAPSAWSTLSKAGKSAKSVTVAVADTGCDVKHKGITEKSQFVGAYNAVRGGGNVADDDGHGTFVAGMVSETTNGTKIMPVKIAEDGLSDTATMVKAYRYIIKNARKHNVRVVNMSFGCKGGYRFWDDYAMASVIDEAYQNGIVSVFPAGNDGDDGPDEEYPVDLTATGIGVIAMKNVGTDAKPDLQKDDYSNYNQAGKMSKQLCAPGSDVVSTIPGSYWTIDSGTSFAAPCVAGVAAMTAAAAPKLSARDIRSLLFSTAMDASANPKRNSSGQRLRSATFTAAAGYGIVDAAASVSQATRGLYIAGKTEIAKGASTQLSVPNASGTWKWRSTNGKVAAVSSSGKVKGVGAGHATIWASSGNQQLCCIVTVLAGKIVVESGTKEVNNVYYLEISGPRAGWKWSVSNPSIATVEDVDLGDGYCTFGLVTNGPGTVTIKAKSTTVPGLTLVKKVRVCRAENPLEVKAKKSVTAKAKALKKRNVDVKNPCTVKYAVGSVKYSKASGNAKIQVKSNGKLKLKKGLKRGSYTVKIKVKASGNKSYMPKTKQVKVKVCVK